MTKVLLPTLAEGVTKAAVSYCYVKKGDRVKEGQDLIELVTDKATFNMPSPQSGVVTEVLCNEGDEVSVGQALFSIE